MSKYNRWENTITPKYQIAIGGKIDDKKMLNCERSAIYNDLVFILAAGSFVGNKAEQRC